MTALQTGERATGFTLLNEAGEEVTLRSQLENERRVLLCFFPPITSAATIDQAARLSAYKEEFLQKGVEVFGVGSESVERLAEFSVKQHVRFSLLSDSKHEVSEAYGAWQEKSFMGKTHFGIARATFLIGVEGKVEQVFTGFKASEHHQVVLDYLKRSQG
ncbi:thioredoxin-dependent thiol peroxidase [Streptomyces xanthochromogenes]|uniref:thioredoxin-dependent thiol peroxidase n=1 Tax=Streptomyces xanthochromogenes TaxID=67384 RepID=UPI0038085404